MTKFGEFVRNNKPAVLIGIAVIAVILVVIVPRVGNRIDLPKGEPVSSGKNTMSNREILLTNGVKHSIDLNEVLAGGPPKDGIPSIDNPKFVSADQANFLAEGDVGLGLILAGEARFYPYQILVWHEIVNDTVKGEPVLVTYCPLCATGIAFERRVNGVPVEFGVSGQLWQSNLLMYDRAENPADESLWSQILGEAVVGPRTGARLKIIPADTVKYAEWKRTHPDTRVLSRDTGAGRPYGQDPYGDYYTSNFVGFGAEFNDSRLNPKDFVLGIELEGKFKAYLERAIPEGSTSDTFAGETIRVEKDSLGRVRFFRGAGREPLSQVGSFWFSWVAAHPDTELLK